MTIIRKKIPKNTYDKFDMMWLKSVKISNGLEQRKLWKQKFWKFGKLEIPKLKIKSSLVEKLKFGRKTYLGSRYLLRLLSLKEEQVLGM